MRIFVISALVALVSITALSTASAREKLAAMQEEAVIEYSPGMSIPVDGSSLEAFDKSLETIKAETTEEEYTSLQNALDYLLIYDFSSRRDKEKLAANLDGLTGEEILGKVHW